MESKIAKLIELRRKIKKKKPSFTRADSHKIVKVSASWRQPRGTHSKTRRKRRGKKAMPSRGYSSPKKVRGMHGSGMEFKVVSNIKELASLPKGAAVMLKGTLGIRKKLEVVKKALEHKLVILNLNKAEEFVKQKEEDIAEKKKDKSTKKEKKKKAQEELQKKAAKKEEEEQKKGSDELAEKVETEETKKGDKSEKIKVLEKKQ